MIEDFIDLSKFEKKKKIGKGNYGKVYIVQDKSTKSIYAAKISIKGIDKTSAKEMLNISREVNIMSKLNHPSVLKFIGYSPVDFENNSKPVIITEYSQNGSLESILELERKIKNVTGWDNTKKLITIYGIASGMDYLHSHDILHRDLKPDNIFLDDFLCPKIADFGLSKINNDISSSIISTNTKSGLKGTPLYMAPELRRNEYSPAGDVYAFSYIVYEILTGNKPFKNYGFYKLVNEVISGNKRPEFPQNFPKSFRNLLVSCWSPDPKNRPPFSSIVEQLKSDKKYLIKGVNEKDYYSYVNFIDKSKKAFDSTRKIIHLSDYINSKSRTYQKVELKKIIEEEKIVENEDEDNNNDDDPIDENDLPEEFKFMSYTTFSKLEKSCQKVVLSAEKSDSYDDIFYIACSFIEGNNKFPKNVKIGTKYLEYNVNRGDVESIEYYLTLIHEGEMTEKDEEKVIKILTRAAKKFNNSECKFKLVKILLSHQSNDINDSNDDVNYVLAKKYCKEAADEGVIPAMLLYSQLSECQKKCKYGEININCEEVLKYAKLSADNDDPDGIANYGSFFEMGYFNMKPNPNKAIEYYKKAYEKGSITGCAFLGHAIYDGVGDIIKNEDEGSKLIEFAYENKDPYGTAVYCNINSTSKKFKKLLREALNLGHPLAYKNAGIYYLNGQGVKKNIELAVKFLKRAMEKGSLTAAIVLGDLYREGRPELGMEPNLKRALKYYKFAADNGEIANISLYPFYLSELDNAIDYKDDIEKYLKKGIELEMPVCMLNYGILLFAGRGLQQNMPEGIKYVKMAADLGFKPALELYPTFAQVGMIDKKEAFLYKQMTKNNDDDDECLIQ